MVVLSSGTPSGGMPVSFALRLSIVPGDDSDSLYKAYPISAITTIPTARYAAILMVFLFLPHDIKVRFLQVSAPTHISAGCQHICYESRYFSWHWRRRRRDDVTPSPCHGRKIR